MNRELLMAVRQRVAEVGEAGCDMMRWASKASDRGTVILNAEGACGTTGCIAGHAIAIATGKMVVNLDADGSIWSTYDGYGDLIEDVELGATRYLDLNVHAAHALFYPEQWPYKFARLRTDEGDAKSMIAFLDAIIDGLYVWDENGWQWRDVAELEEELAAEFEAEADGA